MNHFLAVFLIALGLTSYAQIRPDGPYKDYHDSGELMLEGQYKNGKRFGEWIAYHKNGQIANISTFTDGKKDIPEISYFENGNLKRKIEKIGDIHRVREYYETGELFFERAYKNGYYKEFREDSTIKVEANYKDFLLYGKWKSFDENENLVWSISYENGYRNGIYQEYYSNGILKVQGIIIKDRKKGEEKRYDELGNIVWKGYYDNDEFSKTWINYNAKGKKVKKVNTKKETLELSPTDVPDGVLEKIPVFPGCESVVGNQERKRCANQRVSEHIVLNFNKNLISNLGLSPGRKRVFVTFKVDESGTTTEIQTRGPHPAIEQEAERVIRLLPNVQPATRRGKPTTLPFSIPIVFNVE